jgi:hypothetical protein
MAYWAKLRLPRRGDERGRGMRRYLALVLLAATMGSMPLARAAAPSNDNFANATAVGALPYTDTQDVAEATIEPLEPMACAPTTHTVWYSFTAPAQGTYIIDTNGSDFDTVLTVYVGSELASLSDVACDDDAYGPGGASRVVIYPEEGDHFYIQAGGWATESGTLAFHVSSTGAIAGTVTDEASIPLAYVCVVAESAEDGKFPPYYHALTGPDGTYTIEGVPPGDYKVAFFGCIDDNHQGEYYDDKPDWDSADVITVTSGATLTGIDAALAAAEPPVERDPTDVAITALSVENVPIQTDGIEGYAGWVRRVHVTAANLSDVVPDAWAFVTVEACPASGIGDCTSIGGAGFEPSANTSHDFTFKWNGFGSVGDFNVNASVCVPYNESNYDNNYRSIDHYVLVGGTGFGVNAVPDRGGFGFYGCWDVVILEPVPVSS